jgi:hypothetical protein
MKTLHVATMLGAVVLFGCTRESPQGGPGVKTTNTTTATSRDGKTVTTTEESEARDSTFTIQVPGGGTNITQGKSEEVSVSVNRGTNFKQPVKLSFKAPAGVKVVPSETTLATDDTKTNVRIEATDEATVGRHSITVTGTPTTGKSTSVTMDVDVKKKS